MKTRHLFYFYLFLKVITLFLFVGSLWYVTPEFSFFQIGILQVILGVGAVATEFIWNKRGGHHDFPRIFKIMFWWSLLDLFYLLLCSVGIYQPEVITTILEYKFYVVQAILLIIVSTSAVYLYRI